MILEELKIGQRSSLKKVINKEMIEAFAEISGDKNPVHLDDKYAQKTIFKGRIAHGILVSGLISAVIANQLPGEGTIYLSQTLKFLRPVRVDDEITAEVEILNIDFEKSRVNLRTTCINQNNIQVIDGEALVLV